MANGEWVFVTGGHGFVGSWVVKALLARGYNVRCLVRATSKTHRIDDLDVEKVVGDILDAESIAAGMKGAAFCIHLAGISAYKDMHSERAWPTIVDGTANVLEAALAEGVKRTVYIGSGMVYGSPEPRGECDETTPFVLGGTGLVYAEAKHANELAVTAFAERGLDVVTAIPMETYGPQDDEFLTTGYLKEAINGWPALATRGGTSFAHVEDVALGVVLSMERGVKGERYILGGNNGTVKEIIDLCLDVAGQKKRAIVLPTGLTKFVVNTLFRLGLPSPEHPNAIEYGTLFAFASSEKAKRELGYNPRSGREVMESTIAWLREEGHVKS